MWSPAVQRLIILVVIIFLLLRLSRSPEELERRDLKRPDVFEAVVEANSLWVDDDEEKKFSFYKNIPAFAQASNRIAVLGKAKTAVCETDHSIGQQILCSLQEKQEEDSHCDSDSLKHYADFTDLRDQLDLDKNFIGWKILFPKRDPMERLLDHFMDTCVREARPCFDCQLDLKCYLTNIYSVIKDLHKNIKLVTEDHLKYIPQTWFCQMEKMAQRYTFVDYTDFANPSNPLYAERKRPGKLNPEDIFNDPLSSYEKINKYYLTFIHARPDVIDLIKKIYYWDFLLLKVPEPVLKTAETKEYKDGWH